MPRSRILIIEDCELLRQTLRECLGSDYDIDEAGDGESGLKLLSHQVYNLVIVDVGLPTMDGFKFCAAVKAKQENSHLPIIFLSGRAEVEDKLVGFSVGACDFITKPVDLRELKARINYQLKNKAKVENEKKNFDVGCFRVDLERQIICTTDNSVVQLNLSPLEFKLLYFFLTHIDHVLSRNQLLDEVWGDGINVSDRSVDVVISKLRQKLGILSHLLQSVRGEGYRFGPASQPKQKVA